MFNSKEVLQEYHRLEGDPDASISPWNEDTRIITFSVPLTGVPDVVKRAIGINILVCWQTLGAGACEFTAMQTAIT